MTTRTEQRHKVIWLAPWCNECERRTVDVDGRTWCKDNVFEPCSECGQKPLRYILDKRQER